MKTVRVFLACVMLAMLLYVMNVGPVAVYGDDDAEPLCSQPPIVDAGAYEGCEGSVLTRIKDSTASDPEGDPLTYSWSLDSDAEEAGCTFDDPSLLNPELTCLDDGEFTATLWVRQHSDAPITSAGTPVVSDTAPITVWNCLTCERVSVDPDSARWPGVPVDDPITFSGYFSDPGPRDTHTATWDWGDGTEPEEGTVTPTDESGNGSVQDQYSYDKLGLYTVQLTVSDDDGASDTSDLCTTGVCVYGPIHISPPIPLRKADPPGEIFHTISVTVPALVPGCPECYCLSSQRDECVPMVVDDVLAIFLNGTKIFEQDFAPRCQVLRRAPVKLPREVSEQIVGREITIQFQDSCGTSVRSDEVWLVPADCEDSNSPPTCEGVSVDPDSARWPGVLVDYPITFSGYFSDPDVLDTHTAEWDWGDGTEPEEGTVTQGAGSGSVNDQHRYDTPGVYTVQLTVSDDEGASDTSDLCTAGVCVFGPIPVSDPIPLRPANPKGEIFFTTPPISVPELVPGCPQCYCLSSQPYPGNCEPIVVDDVLDILVDGTKIFEHDFAPRCQVLRRNQVLLPESTSQQLVGRDITIQYRDKCGKSVRSDQVYLVPAPCAKFQLPVGPPLPWRPVTRCREVFYTTSVRVPDPLPAGGSFYFSSQPDRVTEIVIDDKLTVSLDGDMILDVDFARGYPLPDPPRDPIRLQRQTVEVPREIMEQMAGKQPIIEYRDWYCGYVASDQELWLIWVPEP